MGKGSSVSLLPQGYIYLGPGLDRHHYMFKFIALRYLAIKIPSKLELNRSRPIGFVTKNNNKDTPNRNNKNFQMNWPVEQLNMKLQQSWDWCKEDHSNKFPISICRSCRRHTFCYKACHQEPIQNTSLKSSLISNRKNTGILQNYVSDLYRLKGLIHINHFIKSILDYPAHTMLVWLVYNS